MEVLEPIEIRGSRLFVRASTDLATQLDTIAVVDGQGLVLAQMVAPAGKPARFSIYGVVFDVALHGNTIQFAPVGMPPLDSMKIDDLKWTPPPSPPPQILFRIGPRGSGKTLSILMWLAEDPSRRVALFASQEIAKRARKLAVRNGLADRLEWWNLCPVDHLEGTLRGHQKPLEVAIDDLDLVLPGLLGMRGVTVSRATVTGYFDDEGGDNTWNRSPNVL